MSTDPTSRASTGTDPTSSGNTGTDPTASASTGVRAGIVVTGTEVLSGIVADRNGPWLSERVREHGVELAHIIVVGDRPADMRAALDFLAREGVELIVTSGGLGPTARPAPDEHKH